LKSGLNCVRAGKEDRSIERIFGTVLTFTTQFSKKDTGVTWKDAGSNGGAIR